MSCSCCPNGGAECPVYSLGIGVLHLLISLRRTGAIAIGIGAATAVVLSLAGAKTPVVIGSSAALGIAGGLTAGELIDGSEDDFVLIENP